MMRGVGEVHGTILGVHNTHSYKPHKLNKKAGFSKTAILQSRASRAVPLHTPRVSDPRGASTLVRHLHQATERGRSGARPRPGWKGCFSSLGGAGAHVGGAFYGGLLDAK